MNRNAKITRKTGETSVDLSFNIDGTGQSKVKTGIAFFDHMLDLFTKHGYFDLDLTLKGDLEVDYHHSVEDAGICLGQAFKTALGDARGIKRYASGLIPMDEACCEIALDISNRPVLIFECDLPKTKVGTFDVELVEEFFNAFVSNARVTLHIKVRRGTNLHHIIEACFKAFGRILGEATAQIPGRTDIPSTKGIL
jgi:imidazoleglycerol-phosphate dehydratase